MVSILGELKDSSFVGIVLFYFSFFYLFRFTVHTSYILYIFLIFFPLIKFYQQSNNINKSFKERII